MQLFRYSASPLRILADNRALTKSWPPTMIVHGDLDAIVPVEHSFHFLSSLVRSDATIDSRAVGDSFVEGIAAANRDVPTHAYSSSSSKAIPNILSAGKDDETKIRSGDVCARQNTEKEIIKSPTTLDTPLLPSKGWQIRPQDVLITIPGAKHSFEAVGGETLDIVCAGVISWLTKLDSN